MKGTEHTETRAREVRASGDVLDELFRHASPRRRPPADQEREIRETLHAQWREMTARRKRRRVIFSLAAAASLLLAVLVGTRLSEQAGPPAAAVRLASIEKVQGSVFIHPANGGPATPAQGSGVVQTEQRIVTGLGSRLALRWRDGASVRIDENTEIYLEPPGEIRLTSGQVYVDSHAAQIAMDPLVILTPAGPVRHLGTQYQAFVSSRTTRISVREGQVAIEMDGLEVVTGGGEQLIVDPLGPKDRRRISRSGDLWAWTQEVAPVFESDGRTLSDFLEYVTRETGRTIVFASPQAEQSAAETRLSGRVELEPMRALYAILQTTNLFPETSGEAIVIELRQ